MMQINDLFKDRYHEINNGSVVIDEFLVKEEDASWQKIIKAAYLHDSGNEMYILLDCSKINESDWLEVIEHWELNILGFVNNNKQFNKDGKMYFLKYNITIIILCNKNIDRTKHQTIYEIERSQKICRKIFIGVDDQFQPDDTELDLLPFYFNDLVDDNITLEDTLKVDISRLLNRNISLEEYKNADVYDEGTLQDIERIFGGTNNE